MIMSSQETLRACPSSKRALCEHKPFSVRKSLKPDIPGSSLMLLSASTTSFKPLKCLSSSHAMASPFFLQKCVVQTTNLNLMLYPIIFMSRFDYFFIRITAFRRSFYLSILHFDLRLLVLVQFRHPYGQKTVLVQGFCFLNLYLLWEHYGPGEGTPKELFVEKIAV